MTTERDGPGDQTIIDTDELIERLASGDWVTRVGARNALEEQGEAAAEALARALENTRTPIRWEAAKALRSVRSVTAIPRLLAALEDIDGGVRWLAADALIATGEPTLIPLLRRLLQRADSPWYKEGAHHVLRALARPETSPVVHALEGQSTTEAVPPVVDQALRRLED